MIKLTRKFRKLSTLYSVVFIHVLWGLFWGNPEQEVHFIIAFILLYFTQYYFLDAIFLPTIARVEKFVAKKLGTDNSFIEFVEDD